MTSNWWGIDKEQAGFKNSNKQQRYEITPQKGIFKIYFWTKI